MDKERTHELAAKAKALFNDVIGVPPGDKTPHGKGRPVRKSTVPEGGITSAQPERPQGRPLNRAARAGEE
jgi:hypothetical protein